MSRLINGWFQETDPSGDEVAELLCNVKKLIDDLDKKFVPQSYKSQAANSLKDIYDEVIKKLPYKAGVFDKEEWAKKSSEERTNTMIDLVSLKQAMSGLDYPNIRAGILTFVLLAIMLFVSVGSYLILHKVYSPVPQNATNEQKMSNPNPDNRTLPQVTDIVDLHRRLEVLNLQLNATAASSNKGIDWTKVDSSGTSLIEALHTTPLSFRSEKQLGILKGAIEQKSDKNAKQALAILEQSVAEDLTNPPANYLWTKGSGKWFELSFWAFFGVIVGLMYYVTTRLKAGLFNRQDGPTMLAEILMAPLVVCVIFFMFGMTDITSISLTNDSFFVILGFSFILGYAIRRTVGILDNLKKRLLPDP